MPIRNRPRLVATTSSTSKLFVDDLREVGALARDEKKYRSDVIRELVHEALRQRRLRALGRDESENHVRKIYQETVVEAVTPLQQEFAQLRQQITTTTPPSEGNPQAVAVTKWGDTLPKLFLTLLRQSIATESLVKVLLTVGMQKDGVAPEAIKQQLTAQEEAALQQARELIQRLLGDYIEAD
jgi:hypothetical protein